ncbi:MAG: glycine cleavage system protein GcvH [Candidatus Thermoplasmatota archaeon]|nr:glycine cleavage system protein GcvH [Candidatus Thermoplasmatota archaeon]
MKMTKVNDDCKYTSSDEWIRVEGSKAKLGITDFAQDKLNDLTYVDLPKVGDKINKGDEILVVESVKSAAEIMAPVSGTITAVNTELDDNAGIINQDPYGEGWIVEIEMDEPNQISTLLSPEEYRKKIGE